MRAWPCLPIYYHRFRLDTLFLLPLCTFFLSALFAFSLSCPALLAPALPSVSPGPAILDDAPRPPPMVVLRREEIRKRMLKWLIARPFSCHTRRRADTTGGTRPTFAFSRQKRGDKLLVRRGLSSGLRDGRARAKRTTSLLPLLVPPGWFRPGRLSSPGPGPKEVAATAAAAARLVAAISSPSTLGPKPPRQSEDQARGRWPPSGCAGTNVPSRGRRLSLRSHPRGEKIICIFEPQAPVARAGRGRWADASRLWVSLQAGSFARPLDLLPCEICSRQWRRACRPLDKIARPSHR